MRGEIVYLDSSAIVKRYIKEPGSNVVRELYIRAYSGDVTLSYSMWNIGEVLGALDRAKSIGRLDDEKYGISKRRLLMETRRMLKLGLIIMVPLKMRILGESWELMEKHNIYAADAIQITSSKYVNASQFITGDKRLHEVAVEENLNSKYLA